MKKYLKKKNQINPIFFFTSCGILQVINILSSMYFQMAHGALHVHVNVALETRSIEHINM